MAAHEGLEAQRQPLLQQGPELVLVLAGEDADLGQVDGHHPLVKPALELIVPVLILPGGQEGPAAHGREHIALVVLPHLLGGDVVGVHPLGGAFYRQTGDIVVLSAL